MDLIKPITVEVEREVWEKFKMTVTRDRTLNDAVVDLIKLKVKEAKQTGVSSTTPTMIPDISKNTSEYKKVSFPEVGK